MFQNDHQRAVVCAALTKTIPPAYSKGPWWITEGNPRPSDRAITAIELLEDGSGLPISTGEKILLRTAWDIWNGRGMAPLGDVIARLSPNHIGRIGRLIVAIAAGPLAIDLWLAAER